VKPLDLSESFLATVRKYPKETRERIGRALQLLERDFGHPHRHQGLGVRKLSASYFEIRVGLDLRLVFQNQADCLLFVMVGNHDEVRRFLRGR
jgi:mRNA-degrading endonuclease YafQ of YafQ-DinJ toxin-antitoxin module